MPYWDHKEETQGIASPLCDSYNKGKCQVCLYDGPGFSLLCAPPPPTHTQTVRKVSARAEKSVPHYRGDNGFSILTGGTFTFKTVSPHHKCLQGCFQGASQVFACKGVFGAHLRCLPARVFSGRISGVCLQRCIQGASQVFAIDGNGHRPCKRLGHSQPFLT